MIEKKDLAYFNYGEIENEKFWRRFRHKPKLMTKI